MKNKEEERKFEPKWQSDEEVTNKTVNRMLVKMIN
jgi:hypothetical protein